VAPGGFRRSAELFASDPASVCTGIRQKLLVRYCITDVRALKIILHPVSPASKEPYFLKRYISIIFVLGQH
jgi:hypothetical protein